MSKRKEIGKDQVNTEKSEFNKRVERLKYLGKSKSVEWKKQRRNRSI